MEIDKINMNIIIINMSINKFIIKILIIADYLNNKNNKII